jgi:hypothetical protein
MRISKELKGNQENTRGRRDLTAHLPFLHPFLIGLYPVVALLAANIEEMRIAEAFRSVVIILIFIAATWFLFTVINRDWHKAAILTSLYSALFFLYGQVLTILQNNDVFGINLGRHRYVILIWAATAIFGSWVILRRVKDPPRISRNLTVFSAILIAIPSISILVNYINLSPRPAAPPPEVEGQGDISGLDPSQYPDIYYIIPDSYLSSDILREQFNYDNSAFIQYLEEKGFYVAGESVSNYMWTRLSLTSSLSMNYLPDLNPGTEVLQRTSDENTFIQLQHRFVREELEKRGVTIPHSLVRAKLEELGYSIVSYPSGWVGTEILDADYRISPDTVRLNRDTLNAFEALLLHTSAVRLLVDVAGSMDLQIVDSIADLMDDPFIAHRERVLSSFENLKSRPDTPNPIFTFAHIIAPHEPYVFGPEGEELNYSGAFSLADIENLPPQQEVQLFLDQVSYVTTKLIDTIDAIINNSDRPLAIIIQADHGFTPNNLNWSEPDLDAFRARVSILNAYYLPERCHPSLYPSITPVNSFRVVFNCIFNGSYETLEDVTYGKYVDWTRIDFLP